MPELPEVETVVRGLAPLLENQVFGLAQAPWVKVIEPWELDEFNASLKGRTLLRIFRRGKYICCDCDGFYLVVHLRMTGRLYISAKPEGDDKWVRFSVALASGGFLAFSDARKFGRINLVTSLDFLEEKLGPEPLELKPEDYADIFQGSERTIKVFLLDQKKLAGVGNIYADESLFRAGILPTRKVSSLKRTERVCLGEKVMEVLSQSIVHEGATISWYRKPDGTQGESQKHFSVYGRGGQPCLICGTDITRIVLGQRGTHYCGKCQH